MKNILFNLITTTVILAGTVSLNSCSKNEDPLPSNGNPEEVCGNIKTPTVWKNDRSGPDYKITCPIVVESDLTVEPGVEVIFDNNTGIEVASDGSIKISGTADNPITLRGTNAGKGTWLGLYIISNSPSNAITHCTISGAGSNSFNGHDIKAGLRLEPSSKLVLNHTTVSNSGRDGIFINSIFSTSTDPFSAFSNNNFESNEGYAIVVPASALKSLGDINTVYSGNTYNTIKVMDGRLVGDHVWSKTSVPYTISGNVEVGYYENMGNLTIREGVNLKMASNSALFTGAYSGGYIKISGTESERVVIEGSQGLAGSWKGITFDNNNTENSITNADIRHGGQAPFNGTLAKTNIAVTINSKATLTNLTVSHSDGYGIVKKPSSDVAISNVTYSDNRLGDLHEVP